MLLTFSLIFLLIFLYLLNTCLKPKNFPPGPIWLPIVGNTFLMKKYSKKFGGQYLAFLELRKKYNSDIIGLKLGNEKYVVVFGRNLVQNVFIKDELQGRPDGFFIRLRTMGERRGITMTDGPLWQTHRAFAEKSLKQLGFNKIRMENLIHSELQIMFDALGKEQDDVPIVNYTRSSILNVLWTVIWGNQSANETKKLPELLNLLEQRSKVFDMAGGLLNQIPWIRYFAPNYSGYNLIQNINSKLYNLMKEIVINHKETITEDTRDFIDSYLHEQSSKNNENNTFSDGQLIAICLDFFIAGSLTTSNTLNSAILTVIGNPEVKRKLQSEFDSVFQPNQLPSLDDKQKLPYTEAVLLESQRLQHTAPTAGPRRVLTDTKIADYDIPKNTIVLSSLRSLHYDDSRWENPDKFIPERFLTESGTFAPDEGLCFFGLGKRRCIGEILAKSYLFLAFVSLFHHYDISFVKNQKPPSFQMKASGILLTPCPFNVSIRKRFD